MTNSSLPQATADDEEGFDVLGAIRVLAGYRNMILAIVLLAALAAAVVAMRLPNIYTATAKILPPQQSQSSVSALLSQIGGLGGMAGGMLGSIESPNEMYVAMLRSRNVVGRVVKRFGLQSVYQAGSTEEALDVLAGRLKAYTGRDGVIVIEVDDLDPGRAATLANAFPEELGNMMQAFALTEASRRRSFIEQQLRQARDKLTNAELVLDRTPNTSLKYYDALRDMKYQESVWEILAKQFEMARIDEAKDFPMIQVLDTAVPPEARSRPKRTLIVVWTALGALVLSAILVFARESLRNFRWR